VSNVAFLRYGRKKRKKSENYRKAGCSSEKGEGGPLLKIEAWSKQLFDTVLIRIVHSE
jgi:hypothetical protein